jgi:hypothetical protein
MAWHTELNTEALLSKASGQKLSISKFKFTIDKALHSVSKYQCHDEFRAILALMPSTA